MINKKNINNIFILFLTSHFLIWIFVPSITNLNLPLDTIEALAWGSNLDWGFNKHPPMSAFAIELFYFIFGSQDWAYYLLSQIFVIFSFVIVWNFSNLLTNNNLLCGFVSVILLETIFFYNFTTPEFNVNVCQLPFWALTVLYGWKSFQEKRIKNYFLLGIFAACGFLSKYLFLYLIFSIFLFFILMMIRNKKNFLVLLSAIPFVVIISPHIFWLFDNEFITITYGLQRTGANDDIIMSHIYHPLIFLLKQIGILIPFIFVCFFMFKKTNFKVNIKDQKLLYLFFINILPLMLILITSLIMGVKIRTMWMTPFYLFFGVFFVYIFQKKINANNVQKFLKVFIVIFLITPVTYFYISVTETNKRTDYPGKEISRLVQNKWDKNFKNDIGFVIGDEWSAGNLSYHLRSRPKWYITLPEQNIDMMKSSGVIYTGNPSILKKVCPGVFGTIKPTGYCMIGAK